MCGDRNPWSLALRFEIDAEGGVSGRFQADASMQGYDGILHGGMICALLDAAMTHCLFSLGISAVTGDMRVRFLRSVPCGALVELKARLVKARPPLYRVSAELSENTRVAARATATFMKRPDRLERENVL
jgi:acyl-coenzyme A thioesterase PaaI-like protein